MSTNYEPQGRQDPPLQGNPAQIPPWMQPQAPPQSWQPSIQPTQQGYPSQQQIYQQYQQSPMMPPLYPSSGPQKWYRTNAGIIMLLFFFFPVGLFLMWQYTNWPKNAKWIVTGILAFCVLIGGIANAASPQQMSQVARPTQQPIVGSTKASLPTSTPIPQLIHYPPTTVTDLRGLAAKGDANAIHEFHSESVGLVGACPEPKREVTVDPSLTGQQLAEDLLAYFYTQQIDSPCGSIVFVYHTPTEVDTSDAYTAGRIDFTVTDSSGTVNVDPNANNLTHTLTLDVGGFPTDQEYTVTY